MNESSVKRIAFVNPYLQGGHTQTAEMESIARFVQAANKRNIEIKLFGCSEEVESFNPDFVIGMTYQEAKLTRFPTYLNFNVPVSMIRDVPRFVRNILTYDGFFTASPTIIDWVTQLCLANHKRPFTSFGYFSLPATTFKEADFGNAVAMYMGTNWDGNRHGNIFQLLSSGEYLKCYGPANSWKQYPPTLYGGEIPFDGKSLLDKYHQHAAGLCIGYPTFDNEGVTNNRMFEVAAASALPICADNELNRQFYGDNVLYVDHNAPSHELAEQIIEKVKWIRRNPLHAQAMAKAAHSTFCETISMEYYLNEILLMHEKVIVDKKYSLVRTDKSKKPHVTYLLAFPAFSLDQLKLLLLDLSRQTYNNLNVLIISNDSIHLDTSQFNDLKIELMPYHGINDNNELLKRLHSSKPEWLAILNEYSRLFPNHTAALIDRLVSDSSINVSALCASNLECSDMLHLPESIIDQHYIFNNNKVRMGILQFNENNPATAFLFNFNLLASEILQLADFRHLDFSELLGQVNGKGKILSSCEVTCASYVSYENSQLAYLNKLIRAQDDAKKAEFLKNIEDSQLKHSTENLKAQLAESQAKVSAQQYELMKILSSRSWSYTALLRGLVNLLRSLKRQLKGTP